MWFQHGKFCLGTGKPSNATDASEDCLYLEIYAPSNATTTSKLPVFFFIQGGGFNENSNANYNGTGLVNASGNKIIVVTINYRVGPYGFLTNKDGGLQLNNGLYDQRKGLEWVQTYISQFGGDPDHVVLGGDSAGAASITLHLAAFGGRDDGLFHAAAAESVSFATVLTVEESQYQYDNLALRLGCTGSTNETLACLRSMSAVELQDANYNIPYPGAAAAPRYMYNPVIDGDFIQELTYTAFAEGNFVKVPIIIGDDSNGGTSFAPQDTSTLAQSNVWLKNQFPYITTEQFADINALYPNPNDTCPNVGCYWRQLSNTYGEMRYMCPGLYVTSAYVERGVPQSWHYRWNVEDPAQVAAGQGVPHTVELNAIFGPYNTQGNSPASYYPNGTNANAVPVVQAYWTSFIRSYDPNTYRLNGTAEWQPWDEDTQQRILFDTGGLTSMESLAGSELMERCDYWYGIGVDIRQKR